jgi:hypothetical protein
MPLHAADEPARLHEAVTPGSLFHVSTRSEVTGTLNLPAEGDKKAPKSLTVKGESAIEYDERYLAAETDGQDQKTLRIYTKVDFQRKVGDQDQQTTIRPTVRRQVVLRHNNLKAPFSPDGPLMWQELDLVRTDVFTPALAGLLPDNAVKVGDRWAALTPAIQELTDMVKVEDGKLECRLDEITSEKNTRRARVSFRGTIRGTNEDGANRQELDGFLYFDLDQNSITYLTLDGTSSMLDKDNKVIGTIKGRFTLTRRVLREHQDLSDRALKGVAVEPTDDLTRILFDDAQLGVRFVYPRRWHIAHADANHVDLDSADGNGLRLIIEPLKNMPSPLRFLEDSQKWLTDQKARIRKTEQPRGVSGSQDMAHFAIDVEMKDQPVRLTYYIGRQKSGGFTLSARLLPGKQLEDVEREVESIARSIEFQKEIKGSGEK